MAYGKSRRKKPAKSGPKPQGLWKTRRVTDQKIALAETRRATNRGMAGDVWEHTTPDGRKYRGMDVVQAAKRAGIVSSEGQDYLLFVLLDMGLVELVDTPSGEELMIDGDMTYEQALAAAKTLMHIEGRGWLVALIESAKK